MIIVIIINRIILILVLIVIMFIMKSYTHAQGLMSYHYFYIPVRGVRVTASPSGLGQWSLLWDA